MSLRFDRAGWLVIAADGSSDWKLSFRHVDYYSA